MKIFHGNTIIIIITLLFYIFFNHFFIKNNIKNEIIVASVNEETISEKMIDSLLKDKIYKLKMEVINSFIEKKILRLESIKQNSSLKKLVISEIYNKSKNVTNNDIEKYINDFNISDVDTIKIKEYLLNIYRKQREKEYIDSLKEFYLIKVNLEPPLLRKVDPSKLYSHYITRSKESKIDVYIISDFKCPACQHAEKILKRFYKEYNKKVNFQFIYYSDYIDMSAIACEAASKQNKFRQMHDIIFNNTDKLNYDSIYYSFAKRIGLNMNEFYNDIKNSYNLKYLLHNKNILFSYQIFSTPTFIINNKVLDNNNSIYLLENMIDIELKNINH